MIQKDVSKNVWVPDVTNMQRTTKQPLKLAYTPKLAHTHRPWRAVRVDVIMPTLCCFFRCFHSKLDHAARLPRLPLILAHAQTHSYKHKCLPLCQAFMFKYETLKFNFSVITNSCSFPSLSFLFYKLCLFLSSSFSWVP